MFGPVQTLSDSLGKPWPSPRDLAAYGCQAVLPRVNNTFPDSLGNPVGIPRVSFRLPRGLTELRHTRKSAFNAVHLVRLLGINMIGIWRLPGCQAFVYTFSDSLGLPWSSTGYGKLLASPWTSYRLMETVSRQHNTLAWIPRVFLRTLVLWRIPAHP